ncbi:MAG: hypothetical protein U0K90_01390 [Bacteroidales bacterium]|nr:hypothetical protein [Bacteroidales bacterium]
MSELLVFILIIVALVVILIVFLYQNNSTVKTFVENEQKKTILEIQKIQESEVRKVVTPIQLQAYERLVLFLERMTPNNLVLRCYQAGMTTQLLKDVMIQNIRDEFEHNLSQQLYISEQAWVYIKNAKEDMINTINSIQPKSSEEQLTPTAFAGILFELLAGKESQIELAQDYLKKEIQQKFQ